MKIKNDFLLRDIAGSYVVVPVGERVIDFKGMMTLNDTGKFLWECLGEDTTEEKLLSLFLNEYDVEEETAKSDLHEFIEAARDAGVLEE